MHACTQNLRQNGIIIRNFLQICSDASRFLNFPHVLKCSPVYILLVGMFAQHMDQYGHYCLNHGSASPNTFLADRTTELWCCSGEIATIILKFKVALAFKMNRTRPYLYRELQNYHRYCNPRIGW